MEEFVMTVAVYASAGIELFAALIIIYACIKALMLYIKGIFSTQAGFFPDNQIRLSFGRSLVLALEFLLAADILQTAVAPTWDDIGKLAAIATIRTILNYFLEKELKSVQKKEG